MDAAGEYFIYDEEISRRYLADVLSKGERFCRVQITRKGYE